MSAIDKHGKLVPLPVAAYLAANLQKLAKRDLDGGVCLTNLVYLIHHKQKNARNLHCLRNCVCDGL